MTERVVEDYCRYQLVAAASGANYIGKAWRNGSVACETEGSSLADVITKLKAGVDAELRERANNANPTKADYVEALRKILPTLSGKHLSMLRAHYRAPDRSLTATQLSVAAGYTSYSAVNLQYGLVGRRLWEELPTKLAIETDGQPVYTSAIADAGDRSITEDQWVWRLRPEVAEAIRLLGLDD